MRVIAIIAAHNERRFIGPCLEHLRENGVDSYLIDNGSTDGTAEIADRWRGRGLVGMESLPRSDEVGFSLRAQMNRKEELARELEADWFIHLDPDEVRLPPSRGQTLAEALAAADRQGFNAVNFTEFTFVPTREEPDHDHPDFQRTLLTYYPFAPGFPHRLNAWKATDAVELAWSAGHKARFPGLKMDPRPFPMKHYLLLSVPHAIEKYAERRYDPEEVASGWHARRARVTEEALRRLPAAAEMRRAEPGADLDPGKPRRRHYFDEAVSGRSPS